VDEDAAYGGFRGREGEFGLLTCERAFGGGLRGEGRKSWWGDEEGEQGGTWVHTISSASRMNLRWTCLSSSNIVEDEGICDEVPRLGDCTWGRSISDFRRADS
jgi:hypothetical protein